MTQTRNVRSWLWSALILSVLGTLVGAAIALSAVRNLSSQAERLAKFERTWSEATWVDQRVTEAADDFAQMGRPEDRERFVALNEPREALIEKAIQLAPKSTKKSAFATIYNATREMGAIEDSAVLLAAAGRQADAKALLQSQSYALASTRKARQLEKARREIAASLKVEIDAAFLLLSGGLAALLTCMVGAGLCWARVATLFRGQAQDLVEARDALALHASTLEARIEERTHDLEMAKTAAEAADHAKSAFLAQMSHEIRTPMNGVLGMADALSRTPLDDRQLRMLAVIQDSGDTLLALLNDVLDIAKIEAGKLALESLDFSIMEIVRSTEAMFTLRAHQKGISFAVNVDPSADIWCLGDPTRIKQVLYNLVSNAVKFTQSGSVLVTITADDVGENRRALTIAVKDTGIGIEPEVQGRLFERFSQAETATNRKFGGTGLGLAICKQLVALMDGEIEVESRVGEGSVFRFTVSMPLGVAPERTDAGQFEESRAQGGEGATSVRVLAAEDNAHNRLVLQMFLEQVGIEPVFAENGQVAVELWSQDHFDLILMDVQMPIMSGPEATARIRALERVQKRPRTPIIALTANAMTHHVQECLDSGMDAHVAKPIRPEVLFAAIHQALSDEDEAEVAATLAEVG
ncbi:MAG: ATP-binding protein [Aquidulcibacter sp.]|jgi:signal transduction histidine kinase/AmiR/NasT family two-component response regulator|uniref:ATP-binding protein n=1 Tax=Aquidulcibacter sp. TaxID=2052990 RepID=UPI0022C8E288|nr:ATP-binding protein [Aquidulcibacter sp.]MCE2890646.1 ATP-binding protein [Hyphomonadaceae bacterium]MCZ8209229.1 ATP-binding protein [Aquidulcibacter sp.]